ncbi:crotonase/enoyl-CoA hydratase family protein [Nostocoides sp. F2B08]|uniref:crotonase/enoyl-CoA hydratase family protein n=1 Tax=Nostocoides sp. F2B08 TaxID=2653936 RepID=UPI0012631314|nr:crotonase/enoyl-CoA hydratase family protein [Tetrasphaera sp. F2B08]KAB7743922.1 crotonase/enoyl-CoA hydratase family protein [Tetrasphaera sp. F2B08]
MSAETVSTTPTHSTPSAARPSRTEHITCSVEDGIARVELARPEKLNGLTLAMLGGLVSTAHELRRDRTLRGVVITGQGPSFTAGLDFGTVMSDPAGVAKAFAPRPWRGTNTFQEACWAWRRIPVPVVAAVHGHCYGGGVQIALGADFRITNPEAQWSVLEAKWGLIPDMSGIQSLSQQVGLDVAKRLTMTGEVISGAEATRLGLASATADDHVGAAYDLIGSIATRSPDSVAATKRIFERTWTAGARRTFRWERYEQAVLLASANTKIARKAVAEKVPARYRARILP